MRVAFEYLKDLSLQGTADRCDVDKSTVWKYLRLPEVQRIIEDEFAKTRARSVITVERTLAELAAIMNSDITDYFKQFGGMLTFKQFSELPPEMTKAIQAIEEKVDLAGNITIKLKLHPKMEAVKTAMQHLGLIIEQMKLEVDSKGVPLVDNRVQSIMVIGSPRMDMSITEWEEQCHEAEEAQKLLNIKNVTPNKEEGED